VGEAVGKMQDVGSHVGVPELEVVEGAHFLESLFGRPAIEGDAVGGDEHAAAISAEPAVEEDFPARRFANEGEELGDFLVFGSGPATAGQIDETQAQRLGVAAFVFDHAVQFAAKIDNGVNAELFELVDSLVRGLSAAIEEIADLAEVGDARNRDCLRDRSWRGRRRCVVPCAAACAGWEQTEQQQRQGSAMGSHNSWMRKRIRRG
jgi:hypothetical protein